MSAHNAHYNDISVVRARGPNLLEMLKLVLGFASGERESMTDSTRFSLIKDVPAESDLFNNESHTRLASALASAVWQLDDTDGAIGLEGRWGSGKSSVINFMAKQLSNSPNKKFLTFTFDLWSHGSEDIRAALLIELLAWAKKHTKLSTRKYAQLKKAIEVRETKREERQTEHYGLVDAIGVALIPIVTVAISWLTPFAFRGALTGDDAIALFGFPPQILGLPTATFIAGLSLGLLMLFVLLCRKAGLFRPRPGNISYFNRNEIASTPSSEFQRKLRLILDNIQTAEQRVLIVLDNIDRLPADRIPSIWGEVRSVFAAKTPGGQKKSKRQTVTAIVPYDREYIEQCISVEPPNSAAANDSEKENARHGELIRKTFFTTIRVTPPIAHDWKSYFSSRMQEVFQDQVSSQTRIRCAKIFETWMALNEETITPRNIIKHINTIAMLANQWGVGDESEISVEAMSIYAVYETDILKSPSILSDQFIDARIALVSGVKTWRECLLAISYNVPIKDVGSLFLGERIPNALVDSEASKLLELANLKDFDSVLIDKLADTADSGAFIGAKDQLRGLMYAVKNIQSLDGLNEYSNGEIWRNLGRFLEALGRIDPRQDIEKLKYIAVVLGNQKPASRLSLAVSILNKAAWLDENDDQNFELGECWTALLKMVLESAPNLDRAGVCKLIKLPNNVSFSLGVLASDQWQNVGKEKEAIVLAPSLDDLTSQVVGMASNREYDLHAILEGKPYFFNREHYEAIASGVLARLQSSKLEQEARSDLVSSLMMAIGQGARENVKADLDKFMNTGGWAGQFVSAVRDSDQISVSGLIWLLADSNAGKLNVPGGGEAEPWGAIPPLVTKANNLIIAEDSFERDAVSEFLQKQTIEANRVGDWISFTINGDANDLVKKAVFGILEPQHLIDLDPVQTLTNFDQLLASPLADKISMIVDGISGENSWLATKLNNNEEPDLAISSIAYLANSNAAGPASHLKLLKEHLASFDGEAWYDIATEAQWPADYLLALRLADKGFYPAQQGLSEAAYRLSKELLTGIDAIALSVDDWNGLLDALRPETRDQLHSDLVTGLDSIVTNRSGVELFVKYFPREAANIISSNFYRTHVLKKFLALAIFSESAICISFLLNNEQRVLSILNKAAEKWKRYISENIEDMRLDPASPKFEFMNRVRRIVGLDELGSAEIDSDDSGAV